MTRTIAELGRAVRDGRTSIVELTEQTLSAIERWEPTIHACLGDLADRARRQAERLQRELDRGEDRGPLHGIPLGVKDLIDIEGEVTTAGSVILRDNVATSSAPVVQRLEEAGAVVVAKTNTHEFAFGALTPPTRNPLDPARMPGGSSGGSGALVGAGIVPAALGTDTAGSIREPAALCGVVGLKPTYGRTDLRGIVPLAWSLDTVGPIAATVEDARAVLQAMRPTGPDAPLRDRRSETVDIADLRIATWEELTSRFERDVRGVHDDALAALTEAGAEVVPVSLGSPDELVAATIVVLGAEALSYHRPWLDTRRGEYAPDVLAYLDFSATITAEDLVGARRLGAGFTRRLEQLWRDVDVLVTPAQLVVPPRIVDEEVLFEDGRHGPRDLTLIHPLAPFNLSGHPAVSVPVGRTPDRGFPVSLQVVGPRGTEFGLLDVAAVVQRTCRWVPSWPEPP
ncbi:amidase [Euzebya tangerina]|uniref:amidase n=1 Tax=Euzebya tangerina TaxID=591198 RepID=UPI000E320B8A|nr:amidase [Euzebya tangerina]